MVIGKGDPRLNWNEGGVNQGGQSYLCLQLSRGAGLKNGRSGEIPSLFQSDIISKL